jgi:hypothetical protein
MLATLAVLAAANENTTDTILWIIGAVLVIAVFVSILRVGVIGGMVVFVGWLLVVPGGVSLFD